MYIIFQGTQLLFLDRQHYINFNQLLQRNFKENVLGVYRAKDTKHKVCIAHRQISQRYKACGGQMLPLWRSKPFLNLSSREHSGG